MADAKPNVLLIVADDQRFDTISALGAADVETPNLDALAAEGTACTRHHNMGADNGAVCVPARSMLMSGRSLFALDGPGGMTEAHPTLPERFSDAGYRTFATGKWHNGTTAFNRCFEEGEDVFFGGMGNHWNLPLCSRYPDGEYPDAPPARVDGGNGSVWSIDTPHDHYQSGRHASEVFADCLCSFLQDHAAADDHPFFGYVATTAPHDPRTAPGEYLDQYDPADVSLSETVRADPACESVDLQLRDEQLETRPLTEESIRRHVADYYAMVSHLDAQVGRILETLERTGQRENTVVVFTADHGLALGRHGLLGKQNVYEHSVRVPLLMAGPGIPEGERSPALSCHPDLYPTLCDLADLSVPETVDGHSLVPSMSGERDDPHREALLLAYCDRQRALRTDRFKLFDHYVDGERRTELFDLRADPGETENLADDPEYDRERRRLRETITRRQRALSDPLVGDA